MKMKNVNINTLENLDYKKVLERLLGVFFIDIFLRKQYNIIEHMNKCSYVQ